MRKNQKDDPLSNFISPRTLTSIIRISTALAKLRFNNEVEKIDIDESLRLFYISWNYSTNLNNMFKERLEEYKDLIEMIKKECLKKRSKTIKKKYILNMIQDEEKLNECLKMYESLNVLKFCKISDQITYLNN